VDDNVLDVHRKWGWQSKQFIDHLQDSENWHMTIVVARVTQGSQLPYLNLMYVSLKKSYVVVLNPTVVAFGVRK
jgi:hypothetical protein